MAATSRRAPRRGTAGDGAPRTIFELRGPSLNLLGRREPAMCDDDFALACAPARREE